MSKDDVPLVGGKNANLGEMYQNFTKAENKTFPHERIQVPFAFSVTAHAYNYFIEKNNLKEKINKIIAATKIEDVESLNKASREIQHAIVAAEVPEDLKNGIIEAHKKLAEFYKTTQDKLDLAVRSSATAEDLANASFAGQQESYLNVRGQKELLLHIKKAFASLFNARAISYRADQKFSQTAIALSVAVQKMVRSDRGSSGVMFTLDTESSFKNVVLINASYGLGEYVVKGIVTPDEYIVFKQTLAKGFNSIISKKLGSKLKKLIYADGGASDTKSVAVPEDERKQFVLTDEQILTLAKWACIIEEHYKKPMDIEWAYDKESKQLFIVQARPETVHASKDGTELEDYALEERSSVLLKGTAVGTKIGQGRVHVIKDTSQLQEFKKGEVLVTEITDPDWEPIMKIAGAIVTDAGGRTSHAAIVSRELGIPAIVGAGNATEKLKTGQDVTVSCAEGEVGLVYKGLLKYKINKTDLTNFKLPQTEIKMIIANPELVFRYCQIPNHGVGLAREEFIISNYIKIHPKALIDFKHLEDKSVIKQIEELTVGYDNKVEFFVEKLAYGISMIAAAFYPNEVLLRFSDFKSNEYAGLIGGSLYEPQEENPMIGWRGASRYYDPAYEKAFILECKAVKIVREVMGLTNLQVMVPFCRTPEEGRLVKDIIANSGLDVNKATKDKKKEELHVWVMAELPSNILQAEEFAEIFDGFSIGSNDLTQLTLGLDRDSKTIAHIGNENNPSVMRLIQVLIQTAHRKGLKVGICGQGPSDFPEFAEFLVKEGIDSISLNPDAVLKTAIKVKKAEGSLTNKFRKIKASILNRAGARRASERPLPLAIDTDKDK